MTTISIRPARPSLSTVDHRTDGFSPTTAPVRSLRRRLGTYVRNGVRDRQPVVALSERVLADIEHVHSLHR